MINYSNNDVLVTPDGKWLDYETVLPLHTIRVRMKEGTSPSFSSSLFTVYPVSTRFNTYDIYTSLNNWSFMLTDQYGFNYLDLTDVLGCNIKGNGNNLADVTNFRCMFQACSNLRSVHFGDTSSVTRTDNLFLYCSSLTNVDWFDTSNVTKMNDMFFDCYAITTVPKFDTSNVVTMNGMFTGCTSLVNVPLFNTSNVTDMGGMFSECTSLMEIPKFDTSNVTNMNHMFSQCTNIESIPLFDTSNVVNFYNMCYECDSLKYVPLFDTSSAEDTRMMFYRCYNVESGALALYNQASSQAVPPAEHEHMFYSCGWNTTTGFAELSQIPSDWK